MKTLTTAAAHRYGVWAMVDDPRQDRISASGLGASQRRVLVLLKRDGEQSVGELAGRLELAAETVRGHMNALAGLDLVRRAGSRKDGPGRPEILYGLTDEAEDLFPHAEGRLLRELTAYLTEDGHEQVLEAFFETRLARQREEARTRVEGLSGRERLEEVAAILSEEGFMAEIVEVEGGETRLCLCHCPLKEMVAASRLPCRAEVDWIGEMLGEKLTRRSWMPDGDRTCSYAVG